MKDKWAELDQLLAEIMKDNPNSQRVKWFKDSVDMFLGQMQNIYLESNKILEVVEEMKKLCNLR